MQISIYIPTLDKNKNILSLHTFERVRDRIRGMFIDKFGGVTSVDGKRFWKDSEGSVREEEVEVFSHFVDTNYMEFPTAVVYGFLTGCSKEIKIGLDQNEVFFTINNSSFLHQE